MTLITWKKSYDKSFLTCNVITSAHQKVTKVASHMSMLEEENEGPISNHM